MFRVGFVLILLGWALNAFGQQALSPEDSVTTKDYLAFFGEFSSREKLADDVAAHGKDDRGSRHHYKNLFALTDAQEAGMKAAIKQCTTQLAKLQKDRAQVMNQIRAQTSNGKSASQDLGQQLSQMYSTYLQTVLSCLPQIKSAVGDAAFQRLDQYVRTTMPQHLMSPAGSTTPNK